MSRCATVPGRSRRRGRGELDDGVEQQPDPEVRQRRAEEHRRGGPGEEGVDVDVRADGVEQLDLLAHLLGDPGVRAGEVVDVLLRHLPAADAGGLEAVGRGGAAVDDALEPTLGLDRPGDRLPDETEGRLDVVEDLERLGRRPVHLVHERDDRACRAPCRPRRASRSAAPRRGRRRGPSRPRRRPTAPGRCPRRSRGGRGCRAGSARASRARSGRPRTTPRCRAAARARASPRWSRGRSCGSGPRRPDRWRPRTAGTSRSGSSCPRPGAR